MRHFKHHHKRGERAKNGQNNEFNDLKFEGRRGGLNSYRKLSERLPATELRVKTRVGRR